MHAQSRAWRRPGHFERMVWDHAGTVGPAAHWGQWGTRAGPDAGTARDPEPHRAIAGSTARCLRHGPERFGLIHADLRSANLLVDGERTHVIDFDDCGLGWFLHDMASTLSFIEHRADRDRLMDAWAEGYCQAGSLSQAERDEFPTFLMQRRLQLLAWMGSHSETDLASLGGAWVAATAELGADYIRKMA